MQPKFAVDRQELRGLDQPGMGDHDGMQHAVEFPAPKVQKFAQLRKMWMQIEPLPEKTLQQAGKIRTMIENVGGGQPEPFELASKVGCGHGAFPFIEHNGEFATSSAVRKRKDTKLLQDFNLLSLVFGECCFFSNPLWAKNPSSHLTGSGAPLRLQMVNPMGRKNS